MPGLALEALSLPSQVTICLTELLMRFFSSLIDVNASSKAVIACKQINKRLVACASVLDLLSLAARLLGISGSLCLDPAMTAKVGLCIKLLEALLGSIKPYAGVHGLWQPLSCSR